MWNLALRPQISVLQRQLGGPQVRFSLADRALQAALRARAGAADAGPAAGGTYRQSFYDEHRPHQGIANARPLKVLPEPFTDPDRLTRLDIRHCDRLGGILHHYEHAA